MSKHLSEIETDCTIWRALPGSQKIFLSCPIFEALLSGTRGGGKTDTLLMDFLQHVGQGWGPEWRGILFRTKFRDLNDVVTKSLKWFPCVYPGAKFNWSATEWTFPTGEKLLFRHIRKPSDYESYHGHAYPWIAFEELTNWPDDVVYKLMMSCCRSTVIGMPRKFRATTNPYGVGHAWVKARFKLPGLSHKVIRERGKPDRVAILSYLMENVHLLRAEPDYIQRICEAARNRSEKMAWLFGSWDIVSGGMLEDVWRPKVHMISPFQVPWSWRIDRSFDWGSSKPFSVGWWAESDGSTVETAAGPRHTIKGDLFRIYEWYEWTGEANTGKRMLAVGHLRRHRRTRAQVGHPRSREARSGRQFDIRRRERQLCCQRHGGRCHRRRRASSWRRMGSRGQVARIPQARLGADQKASQAREKETISAARVPGPVYLQEPMRAVRTHCPDVAA